MARGRVPWRRLGGARVLERLKACIKGPDGGFTLQGPSCLLPAEAIEWITLAGVSGVTVLAFFWWVLRKSARAAGTILRPNPEWPEVTNLPDLPPWHVTRREQAGLVARLESGASVAIRAAVAGQGGMGKSTLALAAAQDLRRKMQGVWWVQAATGDSLRSSLALLGRELHAPGAENPNTVQAAQATLTHLRSLRDPWLLIYDNADDTVMVGPWLPQGCPHVRVLLTSRAADWPQEQRLDLGAMAPAESLAMLRAGLPARRAKVWPRWPTGWATGRWR